MAQAHALVYEFPSIASKITNVEDVVFKAAPTPVLKKVTVVYNHFNLEAILAAAALKRAYAEFDIISAAQMIEKESDMYVWIGIDPAQLIDHKLAKNKEHRVYSTHDAKAPDENGFRPGIMEQVCTDFHIGDKPYIERLSFASARFYDFSARIEDLAFVYGEVKSANNTLLGITQELPMNRKELVDSYLASVKLVKSQFNRGYKTMSIIDGNGIKDTIYTAFSDYNFIIALRLMRMAHANFVNRSYGLNGQLVYSSMLEPKFEHGSEKIIMMN